MTPKEKAIELYQKYELLGRDFTRGVSMKEHSKQCALIAVDEIMYALEYKYTCNHEELCFYEEVKREIEKL